PLRHPRRRPHRRRGRRLEDYRLISTRAFGRRAGETPRAFRFSGAALCASLTRAAMEADMVIFPF
ncbi:MAG: hypothetical protein V7668_04940, partial [Cereibacter changlensis]